MIKKRYRSEFVPAESQTLLMFLMLSEQSKFVDLFAAGLMERLWLELEFINIHDIIEL